MTAFLPARVDPDAPVFVISVAAQLADMHPQTLRGYDKLGLVVPKHVTAFLPARVDLDAPVFVISVAAQLADMHPQTLRGYDKLGLVVPKRARGRVTTLTNLLRELQSTPEGARLFTADREGGVQMGRHRRAQLALPGR